MANFVDIPVEYADQHPHAVNPNFVLTSARVRFQDLPLQHFAIDENTRAPNLRSPRCERIEKTFLTSPFSDIHSSPLDCYAEHVEKLNDHAIRVHFLNKGIQLYNGAHREKKIESILHRLQVDDYRAIRIDFWHGLPKEMRTEIAIASNDVQANKEFTLVGARGAYAVVQDALAPFDFVNKIAYRQGEDGFPISCILQTLTVMLVERYPAVSNSYPAAALRNSGVARFYQENIAHYERLAPLFRDILELASMLRFESSGLWLDQVKQMPGTDSEKIMFSVKRNAVRRVLLPTTRVAKNQTELDFDAELLALSSFRHLIESTPEGCRWSADFNRIKQFARGGVGTNLSEGAITKVLRKIGKRPSADANLKSYTRNVDAWDDVLSINRKLWKTFKNLEA